MLLRVVGTVVWIVLLVQFGLFAVASGEPWAWALLAGCFAGFSGLIVVLARQDSVATS